jgi:hypothetical protein
MEEVHRWESLAEDAEGNFYGVTTDNNGTVVRANSTTARRTRCGRRRGLGRPRLAHAMSPLTQLEITFTRCSSF